MIPGFPTIGGATGKAYRMNAVSFTGAEYLVFTGSTGWFSSYLAFSFWIRPKADTQGQIVLQFFSDFPAAEAEFKVFFGGTTSKRIRFIGQDFGNVTRLDLESNVDLSLNTWHHVLMSVDILSQQATLLLNGSDVLQTNVLSGPEVHRGSYPITIGADHEGLNRLNADLAQLWFFHKFNGYEVDFSNPDIVSIFRTPSGTPKPISSDPLSLTNPGVGSVIFFDGVAASWQTGVNRASIEPLYSPFTVFGTLTDAATSPSD